VTDAKDSECRKVPCDRAPKPWAALTAGHADISTYRHGAAIGPLLKASTERLCFPSADPATGLPSGIIRLVKAMKIQAVTPLAERPPVPKRLFSNLLYPIESQAIVPILGDPHDLIGKYLAIGRAASGPVNWAELLSNIAPPDSAQNMVRPPEPVAAQPAKGATTPAAPAAGQSTSGTAAASPAVAAQAAHSAATSLAPGFTMAALGTFGAGEVVKESWHALQWSHSVTQSELSSTLTGYGVSPTSAEHWADKVIGVANNHGIQSVIIGTVAGSLVVVGVDKLRPGTSAKAKYTIGSAIGIVVAVAFFFLAQSRDPLAGKWTLDPVASTFSSGMPPRGETIEFSPDSSGLAVSDRIILPDGKSRALRYRLDLDGKEHPVREDERVIAGGADTLRSFVEGNRFTTQFLKNGATEGFEQRVVSSDRKSLTITAVRHTAQGDLRDIRQYERK
jgi:hypothetical protein